MEKRKLTFKFSKYFFLFKNVKTQPFSVQICEQTDQSKNLDMLGLNIPSCGHTSQRLFIFKSQDLRALLKDTWRGTKG